MTSCPAGTSACDGVCTQLASDPDHCGACGKKCQGGALCSAGQCVCPAGSSLCDGICVTLSSDSQNCGSCGKDCGSGVCKSGQCDCQGGLSCGGTCVPQGVNNCGKCGVVCAPGKICRATPYPFGPPSCVAPSFGTCAPPESTCSGGPPNYDPICVNVQTDVKNCGMCGEDCTQFWCWGSSDCYCIAGECQSGCPAPKAKCTDSSTGEQVCVDTQSDPKHCGICGTKCGAGLGCYQGQCQACPTGTINCNGSCVDPQLDGKNCGGCGVACERPGGLFGGTPSGKICQAGQCVCPAGQSWGCGTSASNMRCVDFDSDTDCGLCGASCSGGTRCENGDCVCKSPKSVCHGSCVNTQTSPYTCGNCSTVCASPQVCSQGQCAASCAGGLTACSRYCVDTQSDNDHCGGCNLKCAAPKRCVAGACI